MFLWKMEMINENRTEKKPVMFLDGVRGPSTGCEQNQSPGIFFIHKKRLPLAQWQFEEILLKPNPE